MPLWEWIAVTATAWFAFAVIIGFALVLAGCALATGGGPDVVPDVAVAAETCDITAAAD